MIPVPQGGYGVEAVANWFIHRAMDDGKSVTHLHLQKLAYIAYGWWLAEKNENDLPLINEKPQAWQAGPVFKSLYHALKFHGSDKITDTIKRPVEDENGAIVLSVPMIRDGSAIDFLESVWQGYKDATASQLVGATHKEGTPWKKHYEPGVKDIIIPDEDIEKYYKQLAEVYTLVYEAHLRSLWRYCGCRHLVCCIWYCDLWCVSRL